MASLIVEQRKGLALRYSKNVCTSPLMYYDRVKGIVVAWHPLPPDIRLNRSQFTHSTSSLRIPVQLVHYVVSSFFSPVGGTRVKICDV